MDELEQACEKVAGESIGIAMAREHFRLWRRLADAVRPSDQPDPIRAKLDSLVQCAQAYLSVRWDEDKAPEVMASAPLAMNLLSLRWELEDEQVTTDLEQASAAIQVQVEQLAQKHGPMIRANIGADQLVDLTLREIKDIDALSPTVDKLRELDWALDGFFDQLPDENDRDTLHRVFVEVLSLGHHLAKALGIDEQQPAAAGEELLDVEEQIADEVAMGRRLGRSLLHILDEVPVDEGCHRRMRANIRNLMDRVRFWREHPGEAYDGQQVADVLMPIITQLLEHELPAAGGAV